MLTKIFICPKCKQWSEYKVSKKGITICECPYCKHIFDTHSFTGNTTRKKRKTDTKG